jgi:hypothetical protein
MPGVRSTPHPGPLESQACPHRLADRDAHDRIHGMLALPDDIARTLMRGADIDAYEATRSPRFDARALPV